MRSHRRTELECRLLAEQIVQVRSGTLTAAAAARRLGVSRKTYYKWEQRALRGMMAELGRRPGGRPPAPADEEKARLRREVGQLRRQLLLAEQRLAIQGLLSQETGEQISETGGEAKKKGGASGDDR